MRRALIFFSIFGFIVTTGCGTTATTNTSNQTTVTSNESALQLIGQTAPNFKLQTLNGKNDISLHQLLGAKTIVINSWASWCQPCQAETPDLIVDYKKYKNRVQFVGVNSTSIDTIQNAKAFVTKYHIPYVELADRQGEFLNSYGIIGDPTTFFVSPAGKIVYAYEGQLSSGELQQLIQKWLLS